MAHSAQSGPVPEAHILPSASQILITRKNTGLLGIPQTQDAADTIEALLQADLSFHHAFHNESGFHNHIVHHLLSLYGTGASRAQLVHAYDTNGGYQRPINDAHDGLYERLNDWGEAQKHLGNAEYYPDFLKFFQAEIVNLGWQGALKKYLFDGTERSDDLLQRMFAGILHPLIQLMYGVEWQQPYIMAAALAQAAIHKNRFQALFTRSDREARGGSSAAARMPAILDLFAAAGANADLRGYVGAADDNNTQEIVTTGIDAAVAFCAQVKVREDELVERTAEMIHAAFVVASAAAVREGKEPRYDFFLIHHTNVTPIFVTLNAQSWIPVGMKVRMLEWKIKVSIIQWLADGSPPLDFGPVAAYKPRDKQLVSQPQDLLPRFTPVEDDGHTIKLARALLVARKVLAEHTDKPWLKIRDEDAWLRLMYMVLDATEDPKGERWVRGAGFESAWEAIPDRA